MRVHYDAGDFDEAHLASDPLAQFRVWFDEATRQGLPEPNAMVVSSVSVQEDGSVQPSSRTVLLKDVDARGFVFYTNLESRKGTELSLQSGISCVFPWFAMHRQVVVIGRAELIARDEVAEYFRSRPRGSRLGAWASVQSTVIDGRESLEARYAELEREHPGDDIPVPEFWGGWLVRPESIEFWQGRPSRLHDRLRYVASSSAPHLDAPDEWRVERLSP